VLETFTRLLAASEPLAYEQVVLAVEQLLDEALSPLTKAEFLCELARKGETVEEITAFARALREKSIAPPVDTCWREANEILDVCGTGGDRLNTFNISTTVALICAAAGVPVAKHGNRAITSQAGSADVLEALGVRIDLPPAEAAASLRERNFAFFFAPNYHPAFKHIARARILCAERGHRTIFNFLGPLLNPARPSMQLIGVSAARLCQPLAQVLQSLGVRRGMVVCGKAREQDGTVDPSQVPEFLDELSILGDNTIAEFYHERGFAASVLGLDEFPLQFASLADLLGGDRQTNANIIQTILAGEEKGPKRDAVLLNSAAALVIAGRARSMIAGWTLAADVIDSGQALRKLRELQAD